MLLYFIILKKNIKGILPTIKQLYHDSNIIKDKSIEEIVPEKEQDLLVS